jgi:hypothetical protein
MPPLEELIERLELAAAELRSGELAGERAAAVIDDCARLAAEASAQLDRDVRAAESGLAAPVGQLALE